MTKPSPGVTGFSKPDCIALKTAHAGPISRYACALFILSEIQLLPRIKILKNLAKHGCKHVSFDTRHWSFLEINPPLKQQMSLCVPGTQSTHEGLGD